MIDFTLPEINHVPDNRRELSMDEYLEFVMFNLKNCFDQESYREDKKKRAVDVPFKFD